MTKIFLDLGKTINNFYSDLKYFKIIEYYLVSNKYFFFKKKTKKENIKKNK